MSHPPPLLPNMMKVIAKKTLGNRLIFFCRIHVLQVQDKKDCSYDFRSSEFWNRSYQNGFPKETRSATMKHLSATVQKAGSDPFNHLDNRVWLLDCLASFLAVMKLQLLRLITTGFRHVVVLALIFEDRVVERQGRSQHFCIGGFQMQSCCRDWQSSGGGPLCSGGGRGVWGHASPKFFI